MISTVDEYRIEIRDGTTDQAGVEELLGEDDHYGIFGRTFRTGIEVGAYIGVFALLACRHNPHLDLDCYEPEPGAHEVLCGNVDRNGLIGRVHPHRQAVWAAPASVTLCVGGGCTHVRGTAFCNRVHHGARIAAEAEAVALDSIRPGEFVDLLKVDCEGSELDLLPGADLSRFGYLCMEYHDAFGDNRRQELWQHLNATHAMTVRSFTEGYGGIWTGELR